MAAFDASTPAPSSDPNWLGWSRAIKQPEPDKSGEILGKTIGTAISKVGEIGHDIVQDISRSGSEDILRGEISKLQDFQSGGQQTQDQSLVNSYGSAADLPAEVQGVQNREEVMASAKANGALSPTHYYGMVDQYRSDMRSRFPMFRGAIDKGVAQATGITHTAEQLYTSTMRDINSFLTKKDEAGNKLLTEAYSVMGEPGMNDVVKKLSSKSYTPQEFNDMIDQVHNVQARKAKLNSLKEELSTAKDLGQNQDLLAGRAFKAESSYFVANKMDEVAKKFGIDRSNMEDAINNPGKYSSVEMQQIVLAHDQLGVAMRRELEAKANEPTVRMMNPQTEKMETWSYAQLHPGYQNTIDQAMKTFDAQGSHLKDGNHGAAAYIGIQNKRVNEDVTHQLLTDKTGVGNFAAWSKALKDQGMPDYILDGMKGALKDGMIPKVTDLIQSTNARSWVSPNSVKALNLGAKPAVSLNNDVKTFVDQFGYTAPKIFNKFVDDAGNIADPKIPDDNKVAKIMYLTNPDNADVLKNWHREGLQPDTGKFEGTPNRYNVYSALTAKPITDEVRRLDAMPKYQKFHLWDTYKGNATNLLDRLIGDSVRDLNSFELKDAGRFTYDDEKHNFIYRKDPQRQMFASTMEQANEGTIKLVNMGLNRMADIAKAEGSDPNAYIYTTLSNMGYKFEDHPKTVAGAMLNSIVANRLAERKVLEEQRRKARELGERQ